MFTGNYRNIVDRLYPNTEYKVKKIVHNNKVFKRKKKKKGMLVGTAPSVLRCSTWPPASYPCFCSQTVASVKDASFPSPPASLPTTFHTRAWLGSEPVAVCLLSWATCLDTLYMGCSGFPRSLYVGFYICFNAFLHNYPFYSHSFVGFKRLHIHPSSLWGRQDRHSYWRCFECSATYD